MSPVTAPNFPDALRAARRTLRYVEPGSFPEALATARAAQLDVMAPKRSPEYDRGLIDGAIIERARACR